MTGRLEKVFGSLSKTLFFEYQTLREIAGYFLQAHAGRLGAALSVEAPASVKKVEAKVRPARFEGRAPARPSGALDIAIIGLSGRYPQARDLEAFWENLRDGRDCITEVPPERWDWRRFYTGETGPPGLHGSKWGGFIEDVDRFDPLFFNISPRDASYLDPQERLFLTHAWMALEDAGYRREDLRRKEEGNISSPVGVYAGVMYSEYQLFGAESSALGQPLGLGGSYASIANRVSYCMNLHGPSMTIDSMCSSSLTSLHLACQDLKHGRIDLGIAGGVNVTVHPNKYLLLSNGQFISSEGHCESFGEGGDGYIPGEGVGVALLKRLADAERDGDHIYGVIKGSALNHGGKTNGYSVPNPNAQRMVVAEAIREAGVDPRAISYIEAHGTGTKLGDPIEITGLTQVFKEAMSASAACWIGSVKSNIGHCESAAGMAGVTKVLLQMKHGQIVPSLHSQRLNPHIDFEATSFVVNQRLRDWDRPEVNGRSVSRMAGVSSFGAGGANAHLIIEEYIESAVESAETEAPRAIILSARNEERLLEKTEQLLDYVKTHRPSLSALAYTLQVGREAMEERMAVIARSLDELCRKLQAFLQGEGDARRGQVKEFEETELPPGDTTNASLDLRLDRWIEGVRVDWKTCWGDRPPRRISLPTYPFARERYWVDDPALTRAAPPASSPVGVLLAHPVWNEESISAAAGPFEGKRLVVSIDGAMDVDLQGIKLFRVNSNENEWEKRWQDIVVQVFEIVRGILADKPTRPVLLQVF
ncbi:MAG: type I polyketide synthase, partial [Verrucomicrobiota bacterium]